MAARRATPLTAMADLTFTGERFLPGCAGEIAYEHWHRYAFARRFAMGKRVLDAACGEGYGSSLLAKVASAVVGIDIDAPTVAHASARYGDGARVRFVEGSCAALPLPDASVDVVVSFETIEHLREEDQPRMLAEFARVLVPGGVVVISSPNKRLYSDERNYANEFHLHELYRDGLARLLAPSFSAQRWYHQRIATWSGIWAEDVAAEAEAWIGDTSGVVPYATGDGMYFIVVAARTPEALPPAAPRISLLSDADDSEGKRAFANAGEVMRLDALLKASNSEIDRQVARVDHLEAVLAERHGVVAERERQLNLTTRLIAEEKRLGVERDRVNAVLKAEISRLMANVDAKERMVSYRQSFRWWLALPWMRFKLWLGARR
jgi:ubiquinone/menaquinone biosynthesis C-methylase UbiE